MTHVLARLSHVATTPKSSGSAPSNVQQQSGFCVGGVGGAGSVGIVGTTREASAGAGATSVGGPGDDADSE